MQKPDLTQREIDPPFDRWCDGVGHEVPDGAEFQGNPTRFFRVGGTALEEPVVVCEPCLVVANFRASQIRALNKIKEELGIDNE